MAIEETAVVVRVGVVAAVRVVNVRSLP